MKKNDTFILKIEDMGIGGEGIGKYEGSKMPSLETRFLRA